MAPTAVGLANGRLAHRVGLAATDLRLCWMARRRLGMARRLCWHTGWLARRVGWLARRRMARRRMARRRMAPLAAQPTNYTLAQRIIR
jgi:hypothetical protein